MDALSSDTQRACPSSITEAGCQMLVRHFVIAFEGNTCLIGRREPLQ